MQTSDLQFVALEKRKLPLVNQFYKRVYKKGIASKGDAVFVLQDKTIICAAKLKNIGEQLLLTGVACDEQYRGNGHASLLINKVMQLQAEPIYCFPYPHLRNFYLALGFLDLDSNLAPEAVADRFQRYSKNRALLLMVYLPNKNNND